MHTRIDTRSYKNLRKRFAGFTSVSLLILLLIISICDVKGADEPFPVKIETNEGEVINENFRGFGAEADPFIWMKENKERGVGAEDIELCVNRIKDMKLDIVRVFTVIDWWHPDKNIFTWQSDGMMSLCNSLDVYESSGTDVIITVWGRIPKWLKPDGNVPTDMDSFTSSIAKFMEYLIVQKKYRCVRYLIIYNEPDKEFQKSLSEYLNMYKQTDRKLKDLKIRDKVKLIGPDEALSEDWFRMATLNKDVFDIFDSHTYAFQNGSDASSWMNLHIDYIKKNCKKPKEWFITEFGMQSPGMNAFQNPALDSPASAIFAADFAITALNSGASAILIWCLHDICYPTEDEQIMKWGLWKYIDEMWEPRYTYYIWKLITRYSEKDARILRTTSSDPGVSVALLQMKGRRYSYLVLNKSAETKKIIVTHAEGIPDIRKYGCVPGKIMSLRGPEPVQWQRDKGKNWYFEDTLMENSLTIYSNMDR